MPPRKVARHSHPTDRYFFTDVPPTRPRHVPLPAPLQSVVDVQAILRDDIDRVFPTATNVRPTANSFAALHLTLIAAHVLNDAEAPSSDFVNAVLETDLINDLLQCFRRATRKTLYKRPARFNLSRLLVILHSYVNLSDLLAARLSENHHTIPLLFTPMPSRQTTDVVIPLIEEIIHAAPLTTHFEISALPAFQDVMDSLSPFQFGAMCRVLALFLDDREGAFVGNSPNSPSHSSSHHHAMSNTDWRRIEKPKDVRKSRRSYLDPQGKLARSRNHAALLAVPQFLEKLVKIISIPPPSHDDIVFIDDALRRGITPVTQQQQNNDVDDNNNNPIVADVEMNENENGNIAGNGLGRSNEVTFENVRERVLDIVYRRLVGAQVGENLLTTIDTWQMLELRAKEAELLWVETGFAGHATPPRHDVVSQSQPDSHDSPQNPAASQDSWGHLGSQLNQLNIADPAVELQAAAQEAFEEAIEFAAVAAAEAVEAELIAQEATAAAAAAAASVLEEVEAAVVTAVEAVNADNESNNASASGVMHETDDISVATADDRSNIVLARSPVADSYMEIVDNTLTQLERLQQIETDDVDALSNTESVNAATGSGAIHGDEAIGGNDVADSEDDIAIMNIDQDNHDENSSDDALLEAANETVSTGATAAAQENFAGEDVEDIGEVEGGAENAGTDQDNFDEGLDELMHDCVFWITSCMMLTHIVEALFVLYSLLSGKRRNEVRDRLMQMGIIDVMSRMVDALDWSDARKETRTEDLLKFHLLRIVHYLSDSVEDSLVGPGSKTGRKHLFTASELEIIKTIENNTWNEKYVVVPVGRGVKKAALRLMTERDRGHIFQSFIGTKGVKHALHFCPINGDCRICCAVYNRELPSNCCSNEKECDGGEKDKLHINAERGLMMKIVEILMGTMVGDDVNIGRRYLLSGCVETFQRCASMAEKTFVGRQGLVEHLVRQLCESCNLQSHKNQLRQTSFDLLGHLVKWNRNLFALLNELLMREHALLSELLSVVSERLIDSNVFVRSIALSLERFKAEDALGLNGDPYDFSACVLWAFLMKWKVRIIFDLMRSVHIEDVNYENISSVNTTLIMFVLYGGESEQELDLLLKEIGGVLLTMLRQQRSGKGAGCSLELGTEQKHICGNVVRLTDVLKNFNAVIKFWMEYYTHQASDVTSLEVSTDLAFERFVYTARMLLRRLEPLSKLVNKSANTRAGIILG